MLIKGFKVTSIVSNYIIKKFISLIINKNNISVFFGPNVHLVVYPVSIGNELNLTIIKRNILKQNILNNRSFFKDENNIKNFIEESFINKNDNLKNFFNNI